MRKIRYFLLTTIVLVALTLMGCAVEFRTDYRISYKQLAKPYDFIQSGISELYWFGDPNTEWYDVEITIDGFKYMRRAEEGFYDIAQGFQTPKDGVYSVRVRCNSSDSAYQASEYASYTYRVDRQTIVTPTLTNETPKVVSWMEVSGVSHYLLTIQCETDAEPKTYQLASATTSFMLNIHNPNAEYYEYSLKAVGDGVFYLTSGEALGAYNAQTKRFTLQTPKNLRVEGTKLVWDAVQGADFYQVSDILNNVVTTESLPEYDITENYLPIKVRAMSSQPSLGVGRFSAEYKYFDDGGGTASNPYLISSYTQLRSIDLLETLATTQKYHYKLTTDIAVPNVPANSVREANFYFFDSFGGEFDGNGKKITNIRVGHYIGAWGIFRTIREGATIKNLTIDSFTIKVYDSNKNATEEYPWGLSAAVFAYENFGTIEGCTASNGELFGEYDAAGIATYNYGTIKDCEVQNVEIISNLYESAGVTLVNFSGARIISTIVAADVYGIKTVAGIASVNQKGATIQQCTYSGEIEGTHEVGGISAYSEGSIMSCTTSGTIKALSYYAGGIVAKLGAGGTVSSCTSTATVSAISDGGQIVGKNEGGTIS